MVNEGHEGATRSSTTEANTVLFIGQDFEIIYLEIILTIANVYVELIRGRGIDNKWEYLSYTRRVQSKLFFASLQDRSGCCGNTVDSA